MAASTALVLPISDKRDTIAFSRHGTVRFHASCRLGQAIWSYVANGLVAFVATLHLYFFVLEMFLWTQPKSGGYSVSRKIVIVQAVPAILALILLWLA